MQKGKTIISQRIESILDFDKRVFFLLLIIFFLLVRIITNDIILKSIPGYEKLQADGSFTIFYIFNTLNYLWTPFALLWKFTVTSFIIWMGAFAFGYKVSYLKIWQFTLFAEIIFLLPEIIKMIYFIRPSDSVTYLDIQNFYPLSLFSMFDPLETAPQYHYPLKALNLFELLYVILLVLGFHHLSGRKLSQSFWVILCSYVFFFLLWLVFYISVYK